MSALDNFLKDKRSEVSRLRKELRQLNRTEGNWDRKNDLEVHVKDLQSLIRRFMKSKMEPARVGNIIINNKIYEQFMKKLKGMYYKTTVTDEKLIIEYGNCPGEWSGKLELFDLTHHFSGYGEVTKVVNVRESS